MKKEEISSGTKLNTGEVKFGKIHNDFSSTEYGHQLSDSIRYDRYKPNSITNDEWEYLLGVDVNNLKHLKLTYGLTRQFIKYSINLSVSPEEPISQEDQENLLLAAIVHDWAEAVVGDRMYDLKTLSEEDTEFEELKKMTYGMYGKNNNELLARINYVTDTVIKDRDTKLGKIFNAIERIGYLRTALRSWQKSKDVSGDLKTGLEWLINNVFSNQISILIKYSETYPAVALYLKENRELINDAFNNLSDDIFFKYAPEEIEDKRKQFNLAQKNWQEYCQKFSL